MTKRVSTRPLPVSLRTAIEKSAKAKDPSKPETEDQAILRIEAKYLARATTPLRAIRAKCVQCQGGKVKQIATCREESCALHPFRMEKHGFHKGAK